MSLFSVAARLEAQNQPFAIAQITECRGSTARHSGQMLIAADGSTTGTIGGGMMERRVIEQALEALQQQQSRMFYGRMTHEGPDAVGSDCGGAMSVFISVYGIRPRLILLGGGHVNQAMAYAAAPLGFVIYVVDTYAPNLEPHLFPAGTVLNQANSYTDAIRQLPLDHNSYVVIATNSQDREALDEIINYPVGYLGLLASRRKAQKFVRALQQQGVSDEQLTRLRSPIGFSIGAETPAEIAISVLAEILQVKNNASGVLMHNKANSNTPDLAAVL
ncbi:XdhC family protein [Serratia microhaemolytica]|uniref:XdhC family protein n=1 Tax=Serratia microhaemolytica TaxID=2675110 RepID=UPI000FDE4835